jgi:twitching motility two-component system response regulator PilH
MPLVMIVDDSPTEVHVMKTALENEGYQTVTATDGAECLELAQEAQPDIILMDVVMPGVNGFEATRNLARDAATSCIPIVIISSKSQETDKIWGLRQGAVDFIVKPISGPDLVAKVGDVIAAAGERRS